MKKTFVPKEFKVPEILQTKEFKLRMLSEKDAEKDYEAVISSINHLKYVFGPGSDWPQSDLSLEENRRDLKQHEKEFLNRDAFAFIVVNLSETESLGCVYIMPSPKKYFDAAVVLWVKKMNLKKVWTKFYLIRLEIGLMKNGHLKKLHIPEGQQIGKN